MPYVPVPKDLTRVKSKVFLNLTKRQIICFGIAGVFGVPIYFLTRETLGTTVAAMLLIAVAMPPFLFAIYEKDGRPLEKVLKSIYVHKFKRPGIRPYQTKNMYTELERIRYDEEVLGIGRNKNKLGKRG